MCNPEWHWPRAVFVKRATLSTPKGNWITCLFISLILPPRSTTGDGGFFLTVPSGDHQSGNSSPPVAVSAVVKDRVIERF